MSYALYNAKVSMQLVPTLKSQKILTGNIKNDKYIMGASDMAKFLKTIWGIQIYDKHFDFRKNDTFADCIAYLKTMNEQSKGIIVIRFDFERAGITGHTTLWEARNGYLYDDNQVGINIQIGDNKIDTLLDYFRHYHTREFYFWELH